MLAAFNLTEILDFTVVNNSVKDILLASAVFLLAITILKIFKYVILSTIKKIAARTKIEYDDLLIKIVDSIGWPFYVFLSIYLALQFIAIPDFLKTTMHYALIVIGGIAVAIALQSILGDIFASYSIYFDKPFQVGDFSLIFEVVYYVSTGDYNKYMDVQQEINLAIKEQFENEGIEFAYPIQTILINNT